MRNRKIIIGIIVLSISLFCINAKAQSIGVELNPGEEKVFKRAVKSFESEDYLNAKRDYSQLITLYPREPYFNLAYGACMVYTNEDLRKAIKFLNYAAQNGEGEAYYYLGLAYHLQYMFDRALTNYDTFVDKVDEKIQERYPFERQRDMAKNGEELVRFAYNLNVIDKKQVNQDKFYFSYELSYAYGEIVKTPDEFRSKFDKRRNFESLMYVSHQHNKAFFSSYGNNRNNSLDIYLVEQQNGKWSNPSPVSGNINTDEDENYPFLHPSGNVLYFSSKGHNSMGGYDIFSAKYDDNSREFDDPINLDFPINTPLDDIMYVTDLYGEEAWFASTRETEAGKLSIFKILVNKSPEIYVLDNISDVRKHAKLEVNTTITADMHKVDMDSLAISDYNYEENDSVLLSFEDDAFLQDSSNNDVYDKLYVSIQDLIQSIEEKIDNYNSIINNSEIKLEEYVNEINELYILRDEISNSNLGEKQIEIELSKIDEQIFEKTLLLDEILKINSYYNKQLSTNQTNLNYYIDEFRSYSKISENISRDIEKLNQIKKNLNLLKVDNSKEEYLSQKQKAKSDNANKIETYIVNIDKIKTEIAEIDSTIEVLGIRTLSNSDKTIQQQNLLEIKRLEKQRTAKISEYKTLLTQYEFTKRSLHESELSYRFSEELIPQFYTLSENDSTYKNEDIRQQANALINKQNQKSLKDLAKIQTDILNSSDYFVKPQIDFDSLITENNHIKEQQEANKKLINEYEKLHKLEINPKYEGIIDGKISVAKDLIEESEILAKKLDSINDIETREEITEQISENQTQLVKINNDINNALSNSDELVDYNNEISEIIVDTLVADNVEDTTQFVLDDNELIAIKPEDITSEIEKIDSVSKAKTEEDKQRIEQFYANLEDDIIKIESETDAEKQILLADNFINDYKNAKKEHAELSQQEIIVNEEKYEYYNQKYDDIKSTITDNEKTELSAKYQEDAKILNAKSNELLEFSETIDDESIKQDYIIEAAQYKEKAVNSYRNAYAVITDADIKNYEDTVLVSSSINYKAKSITDNYNKIVVPIIESETESKYLALKKECLKYAYNADLYLSIADSLNIEIQTLSNTFKSANSYEKSVIGDQILVLNTHRQEALDSAVQNIALYHNTLYNINTSIINENENVLSEVEQQKAKEIEQDYSEYSTKSNALNNNTSDYKYVLLGEVIVLGENLLKDQEKIIGKLNIENSKIQEFNNRVHSASSDMIATEAWMAQNAVTVSEYNLYTEQNISETIDELAASSENTTKEIDKLSAENIEFNKEIDNKSLIIKELESDLVVADQTEKQKIQKQINKAQEELNNIEKQVEENNEEISLLAYNTGKDLIDNKKTVYKSVEETAKTLVQLADTLLNTAKTIRNDANNNRSKINEQEYEARIQKADELADEAIRTIAIANYVAEKDEAKVAEKVLEQHKLRLNNINDYEFELIANGIVTDEGYLSDTIEIKNNELVELTDSVDTQIVADNEITNRVDTIYDEAEDNELLISKTDTIPQLSEDEVIADNIVDNEQVNEYELTENEIKHEIISDNSKDSVINTEYYYSEFDALEIEMEDEAFYIELIVKDETTEKRYNSYTEKQKKLSKKVYKTNERIEKLKYKDLSPKREEKKYRKSENKKIKQENNLYETELGMNLFVYENKRRLIDSIEVENAEIYSYTNNILREADEYHKKSIEITEYISSNKKLTEKEKNELHKEAKKYDDKANALNNQAITLRMADDMSMIEKPLLVEVSESSEEETNNYNNEVLLDTVLTDAEIVIDTDEDGLTKTYDRSNTPSFKILDLEDNFPEQENNKDVTELGLLFRIQFAAYNRLMPESRFNMSPLFYEEIPNRNIIRYMVGTFYTFEGASTALPRVKAQGFNDAFIVAYYNGNRISIYEANRLLAQKDILAYNQQSADEINMVENNQDYNETSQYVVLEYNGTNGIATNKQNVHEEMSDDVKPRNVNATHNVFLTVQIGAGKNLIEPNLLYGITTDYIEFADNGYIRHLNGTYYDLNSVIANRDRIKLSGIGDAFVSAYAYGKKVTVNEALQLLANMTAEDLAKNSESVHVRHSDDANEINVINDTISDTDVIVQDDKEKTETAENLETEFYVQIGAYHSEVEDMLLQRFENIAQEAGIKIVRYDNGLVIYRLGPLSNYQEALIYQKRAKGNGINDAFIVVLRNGQRIPLNQVL